MGSILRMIRAAAGGPDIEPGLKGDVSEGSRNAVDTVLYLSVSFSKIPCKPGPNSIELA